MEAKERGLVISGVGVSFGDVTRKCMIGMVFRKVYCADKNLLRGSEYLWSSSLPCMGQRHLLSDRRGRAENCFKLAPKGRISGRRTMIFCSFQLSSRPAVYYTVVSSVVLFALP